MRVFRRTPILFLPFFLFLFLFSSFLSANTEKPILTVSISSYNAFMNDIKTIGNTASNPAFAAMIEGPIRFWLGKNMMDALNLEGQIGLAMYEENENSLLLLGIPLEDPSVLMDFMTAKNEDLEYTEREDGVIVWGPILIKSVKGWTYLVTDEKLLEPLETITPEEIFGKMENQTIRFWMDFARMPKSILDISATVQEGAELALQKMEDETDEEFEARKKESERSLEIVKKIFDSIQEVDFGMHVDQETHSILIDSNVLMAPESEYGKLVKESSEIKPIFTGFANTSGMLRGFGCGTNAEFLKNAQETNIQRSTKVIRDALEKAEDLHLDSQFIDELEALLTQFLVQCSESSENQSGLVLDGTLGNMNAVAAVQIPNVETAQELFRKCVELAKKSYGKDFDEKWIQTGIQTEDGIPFDAIQIPTEALITLLESCEDEKMPDAMKPEVYNLLGNQFVFAVGGKENRCFIAFGNDPLKKVHECLTPCETENASEVHLNLCQSAQYSTAFLEKIIVLMNLAKEEEQKAENAGDGGNAEDAENIESKKAEESTEDGDDASDPLWQAEDVADLEEEPSDDFDETISTLRKSINFVSILAEIISESEKQEIIFSSQTSGNAIHTTIEMQDGVTKIIGMIPSLILMNAL